MSRNNGRPAAGLDLPSIALFGAITTLLTTGSILNWVFGVSRAWTIPVIVASGIATAWLLFYWFWRFPHMFWRSPRSYRPTTFSQPGLFWRNVIIAMIAGCTLPILAALKEVGLSQVVGSMMLGAFFFFGLYIHLWNIENQRERDLRAAQIFRDLSDGIQREFSLYLRPFDSTGMMPTMRTERDFQRTREYIDIEAVTAEAMEPIRPLIALGKPAEQNGAGRIASTEEEWFDYAKLLVNKTDMVLVLPPEQKGSTLKEVKWILENGHIKKFIFLMPVDWSSSWESVSKEMNNLGLNPPEYRVEGSLFTLVSSGKNRGRLAGAIQLDILLDNPRELLRAIESLHKGTAKKSMPLSRSSNANQTSKQDDRWTWFCWNVFVKAVAIMWLATVVYLWL